VGAEEQYRFSLVNVLPQEDNTFAKDCDRSLLHQNKITSQEKVEIIHHKDAADLYLSDGY
jgi:hypothetical protein